MQKADHQPDFIFPDQLPDFPDQLAESSDQLPDPPYQVQMEMELQPMAALSTVPDLFQPPADGTPAVSNRLCPIQPEDAGAPAGGRKQTQEDRDALEAIHAMVPGAVQKLQDLLDNDKLSPAVCVRVIQMILDRAWGRPEASVRVTSVAETVQRSEAYIMALVEQIRGEGADGGAEPEGQPAPAERISANGGAEPEGQPDPAALIGGEGGAEPEGQPAPAERISGEGGAEPEGQPDPAERISANGGAEPEGQPAPAELPRPEGGEVPDEQ